MPGRPGQWIAVVLIVVGALAAGYFASRDETDRSNQSSSRSDRERGTESGDDPLRAAWIELDRGIEERKRHTQEIAELHAELSKLRQALAEAEIRGIYPPGEDVDQTNAATSSPSDPSASGESSEVVHFDDDALKSQGVTPSEIERLHDRWVEHELERANISDQALREGWFMKPRHGAELTQLDQALRRDLDDDEYDQYLYALGKPNRLKAGEVFAGSLASEAGLRRGDVILSYGDKRIFKPGELLIASSEGNLGESVPIKILRNGQERTLYVDRGPLGALMEHDRGTPLPR